MRNCEQCGIELPGADARVCAHCGATHVAGTPTDLSERTSVEQTTAEGAGAEQASEGQARRPRRFTWTITLIALNVIGFLIEIAVSHSLKPGIDALQLLGANYGPYTLEGQWWRTITSMFLHGDVWHILFNMWALYNIGFLAELIFGRRNFLFLYFLCGLGGSIGSLWWHPTVVGVGASGAIFGAAGALLPAIFFERNQEMRAALKSTLVNIAIFVAFNLAYGAKATGIDNAAHLGGLVTGLALGALIPTVGHADFRTRRNRALSVFAVAAVLLVVAAGYARKTNVGTIHYAKAMDLFQAGNRPEAIREAKIAVERDPKLAEAHYLLADLLAMENRHAEAISELEILVRLRPKFADAHSQLCASYLRVNRVEEAKESCKRAVELKPQSPDYQFNLGLVYRIDRETAEAVKAFAEAKRFAPGSAENAYFYALALEEDGQNAAALREFEKLAAEHPEYKPAAAKIAQLRAK